ncbi:C2H2-like zinc finger protein [Zea mays]|uniref:C2H2-like zinc finger protein n=1 Tax=Zea mays TaxID=4577 RepID=A0A1D6IXD0_MAIZE|nr:C2H2-like zinc finger protein [Zea mays]
MSASSLYLHRHSSCIDDCSAKSLLHHPFAKGLYDQTTTIIEISASPSDVDTWLGLSTLYVWQLGYIDFGIDPPVPTSSALIASSPFVYNGFDYVDLDITSFHDDSLCMSLLSPWHLLCAYSSNMATQP